MLQSFLNSHGFIVAKKGSGSVGYESTYFGVLTRWAVQAFQKANSIKPVSGIFGPLTRNKVNEILKREGVN